MHILTVLSIIVYVTSDSGGVLRSLSGMMLGAANDNNNTIQKPVTIAEVVKQAKAGAVTVEHPHERLIMETKLKIIEILQVIYKKKYLLKKGYLRSFRGNVFVWMIEILNFLIISIEFFF